MDAEVIVVGGGPTGLGLALELGQRGVRVVVIERHLKPQQVPKGQNLTQRTMEHMRAWGAADAVRASRTIPSSFGIGGLTAYGTLLGGYSYDWLQRELVRPYYAEDNERLPQYATETALRERLAQVESITLLTGWTAEHVTQDADGVSVEIAQTHGVLRRRRAASYAIGCDGSRSRVRLDAGITETSRAHDRKMVLLVFRSAGLHGLLERFPGKSYFNVLHPELAGYWKFFGRVDLGNTWFFHAPVPPDTTRTSLDFVALMHGAVGATFDVEFEHIGFWDLRIAVADTYQADRLFIAGDAAHSHPPYGGYGVNTGFEDARNLGWKLAAVLQGWGAEALLESYTAERRPVFVSTARDFIERAIAADRDFVANFDPARDRCAFETEWVARRAGARADVNAFEPHYEGSAIVDGAEGGVSSAAGSHDFAARAGHHLAPQPLTEGGTTTAALGAAFTLLALGADEACVTAFSAAASELQLPLTVVRDSLAAGRERYAARLVLVRPDTFVAWAGDVATPSAVEVLGRAVGHS